MAPLTDLLLAASQPVIDPLRGTIAGALILIGLGVLLIPLGIRRAKSRNSDRPKP
jgi:hypothetical protein